MTTKMCKAFFIITLLANLTSASIFAKFVVVGESVEVAKKEAINNGIL